MHTADDLDSLSAEGRAVLAAAAQNRGLIEIAARSDTRGRAVRAGKVKLFDPSDSGYAKRCCEATPELVRLQLMRESNAPNRYELTNFGWQLSRKASAAPPTPA